VLVGPLNFSRSLTSAQLNLRLIYVQTMFYIFLTCR